MSVCPSLSTVQGLLLRSLSASLATCQAPACQALSLLNPRLLRKQEPRKHGGRRGNAQRAWDASPKRHMLGSLEEVGRGVWESKGEGRSGY